MAALREYDFSRVANNTVNDYDTTLPTYFSLLRDAGKYSYKSAPKITPNRKPLVKHFN